MLVRLLLFFTFVPAMIWSISNQEDLAISHYSHLACLRLPPVRQRLASTIQINSSSVYQTFFSSRMTVELCFRLCRQLIIMINRNHTHCVCLYTINSPYQFNKHLGELSAPSNCTPDALEIYSLTNDFYLLPPLSSIYEWSLDGCYALHGSENYHANRVFANENYSQAINLCRELCQRPGSNGDFYFALSMKKSCYCLPILSRTGSEVAVRKPLVHCSFLSYIKTALQRSFNYSAVHPDTYLKIHVQRYCPAEFAFNRQLSLCLKLLSVGTLSIHTKNNLHQIGTPMLIKTSEQWQHVWSLPVASDARTFIWVDRRSEYIFNELYKSAYIPPTSNLCIIINQTPSMRSRSLSLVDCSAARFMDYILCAQQPSGTRAAGEAAFQPIEKSDPFPVADNISCPTNFTLFNDLCYYVHPSFVYSISAAESLCSSKYPNSTLVKFDRHRWWNINAKESLGRSADDILLEFFYYQLEQTSQPSATGDASKKHWLRLLLGDKSPQGDCVLRYFIRSSGAFTILHQCLLGGHPVCQCEAIRSNISQAQPTVQPTTNGVETQMTTEMPTTGTASTSANPTTVSTQSSSQMTTVTTSLTATNQSTSQIFDLLSDEDLRNNETKIDDDFDNRTLALNSNQHPYHRPFIVSISIAFLALVVFMIGTLVLIHRIRRNRGSYSTGNNTVSPTHRTKRLARKATSNDQAGAPTVIYTKLKPSPPSPIAEVDMQNPFDNTIVIDDHVQLLPELLNHPIFRESFNSEREHQVSGATTKLTHEK